MDNIMRKYGWKPDLPDYRDEICMAPRIPVNQLPAMMDLASPLVPVFDQGQLGSCTANAVSAAHMYGQVKQQRDGLLTPSRLFVYWNARKLERTTDEDTGCAIRDGVKCVAQKGVCPEEEWPYDIIRFRDRPAASCYAHGQEHQALLYSRVAHIQYHLKACLFLGFPIMFGFSVYDNFETREVAETGRVPMPGGSQVGGHANLLVGYDDATQLYKSQNSYGRGHGDDGFLYFPYEFIDDPGLAQDFWKITLVE